MLVGPCVKGKAEMGMTFLQVGELQSLPPNQEKVRERPGTDSQFSTALVAVKCGNPGVLIRIPLINNDAWYLFMSR